MFHKTAKSKCIGFNSKTSINPYQLLTNRLLLGTNLKKNLILLRVIKIEARNLTIQAAML